MEKANSQFFYFFILCQVKLINYLSCHCCWFLDENLTRVSLFASWMLKQCLPQLSGSFGYCNIAQTRSWKNSQIKWTNLGWVEWTHLCRNHISWVPSAFLPLPFFGKRNGSTCGRTPDSMMVVPTMSLLSSSSLRIANWM